jgi:hypothetical protein
VESYSQNGISNSSIIKNRICENSITNQSEFDSSQMIIEASNEIVYSNIHENGNNLKSRQSSTCQNEGCVEGLYNDENDKNYSPRNGDKSGDRDVKQREIVCDSDMDMDHQTVLDNDINKTHEGLNGDQNTEISVEAIIPTIAAPLIPTPIANAISTLTTTISRMASAIYTVPTSPPATDDSLLPVIPGDQSVVTVSILRNVQSVDNKINNDIENCDDLIAVPMLIEGPPANYNGNTGSVINEEFNSIRINTLPIIAISNISNIDSNVSTSSSHGNTTSRIEAIKTADLLMTAQLSRLLKDDIHIDLLNVLTGINNNDSSEGDKRLSSRLSGGSSSSANNTHADKISDISQDSFLGKRGRRYVDVWDEEDFIMSSKQVFFITYILTLLLMPLASLHFCVG